MLKNKKGQGQIRVSDAITTFVGFIIFTALMFALVPIALVQIGNLSSLNVVLISAVAVFLPLLIGVFILVKSLDFFRIGR